MSDKTSFGDRMKGYEGAEAGRRLMPLLPICARIDGKTFSRFTQKLARPYDERLSRLMVEVTVALVTETDALIGYTQSDEISLVFYSDSPQQQVYLDGRVQKMTSILTSMATARFNAQLPRCIPEKAGAAALFDGRVWSVPNQVEAANTLLWREQDATKNSISMAARALYPHKELHGKSTAQMQELLFARGVNWNDYPAFFKRGTFVQRRRVERPFSAAELDALPEKHNARRDPNLTLSRAEVRALEMPPFGQVTNRVGVIFHGEEPVTARDGEAPSP
jgi:tRNA(His) guanylyltransferase